MHSMLKAPKLLKVQKKEKNINSIKDMDNNFQKNLFL